MGGRVLLEGATCALHAKDRVGLVGRNGAGKTTLFNILMGDDTLDSGEVWQSPDLRLGTVRQHDDFQPGETVIDYLLRVSGKPEWRCGEVAGRFDLKGAAFSGPVAASNCFTSRMVDLPSASRTTSVGLRRPSGSATMAVICTRRLLGRSEWM